MKPYWKVTFWYVIFGIGWIFFTDKIMESVSESVRYLTHVQILKGLFYVVISGALIFFLMRRAWNRQIRAEEQKQKVFRKTIEGAHHILLNYLNQMQLVTLEAEKCAGFDRDTLKLSQKISEDASTALMKLAAVEQLTTSRIEDAVYGEHPEARKPAAK
jgi:hypothetical protein